MLMTPMTPKVMASPAAASSSTEPSDRPYTTSCASDHSRSVRSSSATAAAAAADTAAGWPAASDPSRLRASRSPRWRNTTTAARRSGSPALPLASTAAARACCMIRRMSGRVSTSIAWFSAGTAAASRDLNTSSAALRRLSGSGESRVSAPMAASAARRTALLSRTGFSPGGVSVTDCPVRASTSLPSAPLMNSPWSGENASELACNAAITSAARGLPEATSPSMPRRMSSKFWVASGANGSFSAPAAGGPSSSRARAIAPAHAPITSPRRTGKVPRGWAAAQVATSADFAHGSWFWTHFSGGLNYQVRRLTLVDCPTIRDPVMHRLMYALLRICVMQCHCTSQVVHHLFPGICHTYYPAIAPIVLATCQEFKIPYKIYPTVRFLLRLMLLTHKVCLHVSPLQWALLTRLCGVAAVLECCWCTFRTPQGHGQQRPLHSFLGNNRLNKCGTGSLDHHYCPA